MIDLDALWQDMFRRPIEPFERKVMEGACQYIDEKSPAIITVAITVYMHCQPIVTNPANITNIYSRFSAAIKDVEMQISKLELLDIPLKETLHRQNSLIHDIRDVQHTARADFKSRQTLENRFVWRLAICGFVSGLSAFVCGSILVALTRFLIGLL